MKIILIILLYLFFGALFSALFRVYIFDGNRDAGENATLMGVTWIVSVPITGILLFWYIFYSALSEYLSSRKIKHKEPKEIQNNYQIIK